jgi:hypothetical protein
MKELTLTDVDCLITWPPGSRGEQSDRIMLLAYLDLCKTHGYGRMKQIAESVEDIWRNPEKTADYQKQKIKHLRDMEELKEGRKA